MIIKDNMANMCAKVTSTYMEFTLAFDPKPEFSFSFKYCYNLLSDCNSKTIYSKIPLFPLIQLFWFHSTESIPNITLLYADAM